MSVLEEFHIEGILTDRHALSKTDFICLGINFLLGLLIQLRRVRQPNHNGVLLFHIGFIPKENAFNQGCHNNRFSCTRGSGKGNHLRSMCSMVTAEGFCCFQTNVGKRSFLKWK